MARFIIEYTIRISVTNYEYDRYYG